MSVVKKVENLMATAKGIQVDLAPQVVLQAIRQLDDDSFGDFITQVMNIYKQRVGSSSQDLEVELLQTIVSSSLLPSEQAKLIELGYRLEDESISSDEQAELASLSRKSEELNVKRLEAVRSLSTLRQQSFEVTMAELGLLNSYA